jgi:hypothetical protein
MLLLELSVVVIVAKPLVQATYTLEGDGPCAIIAYNMVKNVESWFNINVEHLSFPGLGEAITQCAISIAPISHGGHVESARTHVTERCRRMITPVFDYFKSRIFNKLAERRRGYLQGSSPRKPLLRAQTSCHWRVHCD